MNIFEDLIESQKKNHTEKVLRAIAQGISHVLEHECKDPIGFVLLTFRADHPEQSNYVSNIDKDVVIGALQETIKQLSELEGSLDPNRTIN